MESSGCHQARRRGCQEAALLSFQLSYSGTSDHGKYTVDADRGGTTIFDLVSLEFRHGVKRRPHAKMLGGWFSVRVFPLLKGGQIHLHGKGNNIF